MKADSENLSMVTGADHIRFGGENVSWYDAVQEAREVAELTGTAFGVAVTKDMAHHSTTELFVVPRPVFDQYRDHRPGLGILWTTD